MPVFSFGYKEACKNSAAYHKKKPLKWIFCSKYLRVKHLIFTVIFLKKGLINSNFSKEYFTGNGYEAVIFEGESTDAKAVAQAIKDEVARLRKDGISGTAFETARRSLYGREIMSYNVTDDVANAVIGCYFAGYGIFDALEIYKSVTKADIEKLLSEKLDGKIQRAFSSEIRGRITENLL